MLTQAGPVWCLLVLSLCPFQLFTPFCIVFLPSVPVCGEGGSRHLPSVIAVMAGD
jgi:hypothetical protein